MPVILAISCLLGSPVFIKSRLVSLDQLVVSRSPPGLQIPSLHDVDSNQTWTLLGERLNLTGEQEPLLRGTKVCIEDWSGQEALMVSKDQRRR